jgi:hypothetical protein
VCHDGNSDPGFAANYLIHPIGYIHPDKFKLHVISILALAFVLKLRQQATNTLNSRYYLSTLNEMLYVDSDT